jgi:osmotically-inducible protein OsmY
VSLTTIAVVILGLWVIAIAAAGLVMTLRPGGVGVKLAPPAASASSPTGSRQAIPLGGVAEVFGNFRGRVGAVQLRPDRRLVDGVQLGGGLIEGEFVPIDAVVDADGNSVHLTDGWQDRAIEDPQNHATLRENQSVATADGKRLGRLRVVCYDGNSKMATALVVEGGGSPYPRLVPMDRVIEVGPERILTDVQRADAGRLGVFATDWDLRQAILERLSGDPEFQGLSRSLRIEVRDQRVYVRGFVADRARADRVTEAIRSVPGVSRLDTEITSDDQLEQAVRDAIMRDPSVAVAHIDVTVHGGVVDITGEAPDRATVRRIDAIMQQIEGAEVVHNMVVVPPKTATRESPWAVS